MQEVGCNELPCSQLYVTLLLAFYENRWTFIMKINYQLRAGVLDRVRKKNKWQPSLQVCVRVCVTCGISDEKEQCIYQPAICQKLLSDCVCVLGCGFYQQGRSMFVCDQSDLEYPHLAFVATELIDRLWSE